MNSDSFSSFLSQIAQHNTYVIDATIAKEHYYPIDLSEANSDLNTFDITSSEAWQTYITNYLKKHNKQVAYGGYLEKRNIYNRSTHFNKLDLETERNIHLGLDLWIAAGTKVLAAFNGEIHSFKNNTNFGDYGPTIILKHDIENVVFYTLYGHLSEASLTSLKVGDTIYKGDVIAQLGTNKVNGDYAPHLHFQIIKELQGNTGDYPGVTSIKDLDFYKANCVDPNLVLKL